MSLVVFENVSLSLGGKSIVDELDWRIADHERIGLVGPNGSGKTTLLRMLSGQQQPDGGKLRFRRDLRVGYLAQDVVVEGGKPLLPFVLDGVPARRALEDGLAEVEAALSRAQGSTDAGHEEQLLDLAEELADLHERLAHFEAHFSEHQAKRILAGLGFQTSDLGRDVGEFSGGWKMRAVLASLLFQRPDLLLLDEPTNHLDMPSVAWLSGFLRRYDRAFILISHDREFLNEQIQKVVSFEIEGIRSYEGNYDQYERQREEEEVLLLNRLKNQEKEREHLEAFIDRFRAKASKAAAVQSRVKKLEKLESIEAPRERKKIRFKFPSVEKSGRDVLVTHGLGKSFGDRVVLHDLELRVERGDRIALLGVNGAGKTTLLRILAGEIEASTGSYTYGHNTKLAYYAQHHADTLRRDSTAYEEVRRASTQATHEGIRSALGAMLFDDVAIEKKVGVLSGGERARVALSRILVNPGNVLLMDEPTNHLDLASSEKLAEALAEFDGTLLFVSHHKQFIRRLATKIWYVDGGKVLVYPGTFDDYVASCEARGDDAPAATGASVAPSPGAPLASAAAQAPRNNREDEKARKRVEAEQRSIRNKKLKPLRDRVTELEGSIARLEAKVKDCSEALSDPAVYDDAKRRDALLTELTRSQAELDVATETWMEKSEELEKAERELEAASV